MATSELLRCSCLKHPARQDHPRGPTLHICQTAPQPKNIFHMICHLLASYQPRSRRRKFGSRGVGPCLSVIVAVGSSMWTQEFFKSSAYTRNLAEHKAASWMHRFFIRVLAAGYGACTDILAGQKYSECDSEDLGKKGQRCVVHTGPPPFWTFAPPSHTEELLRWQICGVALLACCTNLSQTVAELATALLSLHMWLNPNTFLALLIHGLIKGIGKYEERA
jgi:hypothetical protein